MVSRGPHEARRWEATSRLEQSRFAAFLRSVAHAADAAHEREDRRPGRCFGTNLVSLDVRGSAAAFFFPVVLH